MGPQLHILFCNRNVNVIFDVVKLLRILVVGDSSIYVLDILITTIVVFPQGYRL